jgi:hypothetical protein
MGTFFGLNIAEVGLFILGVGYLFTLWKQGGLKAGNEVIVAYKEQVALNAQKIAELTKDVGVLTGQLREKDLRITMLEGLTKTTPEQEAYMIDMRKFTSGVAEYMASSTKTLGEISVFMHNLNTKTGQ